MRKLLIPLLLCGLTACDAESDVAPVELVEPTDFIQFVEAERGEGSLQTAWVDYTAADGREVALVAAVHIADGQYFDALQERFAGYDSVLYELVAERGTRPVAGQTSGSLISRLQLAFKDLLELEFQLDAVDYQSENFVHADLDPRRFAELQEERGESLLSLMLRAALHQRANADPDAPAGDPGVAVLLLALASKDRARALKYYLAQQMEGIENLLAGIGETDDGADGAEENEGTVLVTERNKACLEVLEERWRAGDRKVAIFYGAAHMPDFEERLAAAGFARTGLDWHDAWEVRRKDTTR